MVEGQSEGKTKSQCQLPLHSHKPFPKKTITKPILNPIGECDALLGQAFVCTILKICIQRGGSYTMEVRRKSGKMCVREMGVFLPTPLFLRLVRTPIPES